MNKAAAFGKCCACIIPVWSSPSFSDFTRFRRIPGTKMKCTKTTKNERLTPPHNSTRTNMSKNLKVSELHRNSTRQLTPNAIIGQREANIVFGMLKIGLQPARMYFSKSAFHRFYPTNHPSHALLVRLWELHTGIMHAQKM